MIDILSSEPVKMLSGSRQVWLVAYQTLFVTPVFLSRSLVSVSWPRLKLPPRYTLRMRFPNTATTMSAIFSTSCCMLICIWSVTSCKYVSYKALRRIRRMESRISTGGQGQVDERQQQPGGEHRNGRAVTGKLDLQDTNLLMVDEHLLGTESCCNRVQAGDDHIAIDGQRFPYGRGRCQGGVSR